MPPRRRPIGGVFFFGAARVVRQVLNYPAGSCSTLCWRLIIFRGKNQPALMRQIVEVGHDVDHAMAR
jgi:hypothetical protein